MIQTNTPISHKIFVFFVESKTRLTSKRNFVLDSTTFLNFRVPDSTKSSKIACLCTVMTMGEIIAHGVFHSLRCIMIYHAAVHAETYPGAVPCDTFDILAGGFHRLFGFSQHSWFAGQITIGTCTEQVTL